ncbi:MAG: phosphoribosylamine--glycine ligase [Vulcanimicrobiaceae bacterium]
MVGGGGREDALSWALARSPSCRALVHAPGNAGTASRGENWAIPATDGKALAARARDEGVELAVIGPETAIAAGVADRLREAKIATFAPDRALGRLESSKSYAKRAMQRYGIPTANARIVHSLAQAEHELERWDGACVLKADGLAAGKGVVVAPDLESARATVQAWYRDGLPGGGCDLLLEQCLAGRELSVFALGDGKRFEIFGAACDYKRAGEGDSGPNTGGMGAYSPPLAFPGDALERVRSAILEPLARGLQGDGARYVGVIYLGLMWTPRGPAVLEFNVRFGDPETQALMPRVEGDFARLCASAAHGALEPAAQLAERACVAVVLVSPEYPRASKPLAGLPLELGLGDEAVGFWGSSTRGERGVEAAGGRVLTLAACGAGIEQARERAYRAVRVLESRLGPATALSYRGDIGSFGIPGEPA